MRWLNGWVLAAVGGYAGIAALDAYWLAEAAAGLRHLYTALYFAFGCLLLGVLARGWTTAGPNIWRPLTLVVGAAAAAVELWLVAHAREVPWRPDPWMAALLGLAVAALLPRFLPDAWLRVWLGLPRRG